jgi:poly(3-hydroxybutyrate) depolymerase
MNSNWLSFGVAILMASLLGRAEAASFDWAADPLKEVQINTVAFRGWTPETEKPLSGVLVLIPGRHGDGRGMADDSRWQQLATDLNFGILACQFTNGEPFAYQTDARGEVEKCLNTAVDHFS